MNAFPSSAELKRRAKGQLIGRFTPSVMAEVRVLLLMLLASMICTNLIDDTTLLGIVISYVVSFILEMIFSIFQIGLARFYLELSCDRLARPTVIFSGFRSQADRAIIAKFWIMLLEILCFAPTFVCGMIYNRSGAPAVFMITCFVFALSLILALYVEIIYSQVYCIMADFPEKSAREVLSLSRHVMRGHRFRYLYIQISLIPYYLVSVLSFGFALLWVVPYRRMICANFYLNLFEGSRDTSSFDVPQDTSTFNVTV